MSPDQLHDQLRLLRRQSPSISLETVHQWVKTGRKQPRFHAFAWLSRVGWRRPN